METTKPVSVSINQVEYSNTAEGSIIHILGRDESGNACEIRVNGFRPYFYAPADQAESIPAPDTAEVDLSHEYLSIRGKAPQDIYENPGRCQGRKGQIQTFRSGYPLHDPFYDRLRDHGGGQHTIRIC